MATISSSITAQIRSTGAFTPQLQKARTEYSLTEDMRRTLSNNQGPDFCDPVDGLQLRQHFFNNNT